MVIVHCILWINRSGISFRKKYQSAFYSKANRLGLTKFQKYLIEKFPVYNTQDARTEYVCLSINQISDPNKLIQMDNNTLVNLIYNENTCWTFLSRLNILHQKVANNEKLLASWEVKILQLMKMMALNKWSQAMGRFLSSYTYRVIDLRFVYQNYCCNSMKRFLESPERIM